MNLRDYVGDIQDKPAGTTILEIAVEGLWPFKPKSGAVWVDYNIDEDVYQIVVEFTFNKKIVFAKAYAFGFELTDVDIFDASASLMGDALSRCLRYREDEPIPDNIVLGEE